MISFPSIDKYHYYVSSYYLYERSVLKIVPASVALKESTIVPLRAKHAPLCGTQLAESNFKTCPRIFLRIHLPAWFLQNKYPCPMSHSWPIAGTQLTSFQSPKLLLWLKSAFEDGWCFSITTWPRGKLFDKTPYPASVPQCPGPFKVFREE